MALSGSRWRRNRLSWIIRYLVNNVGGNHRPISAYSYIIHCACTPLNIVQTDLHCTSLLLDGCSWIMTSKQLCTYSVLLLTPQRQTANTIFLLKVEKDISCNVSGALAVFSCNVLTADITPHIDDSRTKHEYIDRLRYAVSCAYVPIMPIPLRQKYSMLLSID